MPDFTAGPIPKEALAYLKAKRLQPGFDYRDVWREEHAGAFTVAKMAQMDMLSDMRDSLVDALAKGKTYREWAKDVTPALQKKGWWGVKDMTDPLTGKARQVQLGSPRRLKTIYDANLRTARSAGQWERIQRTKATHPYLLYQLGPSARHRPQHVAWSGTLLPVDDAFWGYAMPANGWGCKCWVRQVSKTEYGRLVKHGYQDPLAPQEINPDTGLPTGRKQKRMQPVSTTRPHVERREWINKRTGAVEHVPDGIDPGWDTNPGQAARRQARAREFMQSVNRAPAAVGAEGMAQVLPVIKDDLGAAYKRWVDDIDSGKLQGAGGRRTIGALSPHIVDALQAKVGFTPATAGLTIEQREVTHLIAEARKGNKALSLAQVRNLVRYLAEPKAVVWDGTGKRPALLYVFQSVTMQEGQYGRLAVRVDFAKAGETINAIRSGGIVARANLEQGGMIRLDDGGEL